MAKDVTISKAEYEYLLETVRKDGLTIAKLDAELARAKSAIKRLLILSSGLLACDFCEHEPGFCCGCEQDAAWNGKGGEQTEQVQEPKDNG